MSQCICRMITFVNNHVPASLGEGVDKPGYVTLGFFDGMLTERIAFDYGKDDLKPLWKQSIRVSGQSEGAYSCQNTFCFGCDDWGSAGTDAAFWDLLTDQTFPLCFVVFFQIKEYASGEHGVENLCRKFNRKLRDMMRQYGLNGMFYTYATIDKNDVVVCIKSDRYKKSVELIKCLHDGDAQIVYSYTVMSVNRDVLGGIREETMPELFNESVDSICLKGIANSYRYNGEYRRLDDKYAGFCNRLIEQLGKPGDYRIYDILGESDFRLIARDIKLGRILNALSDDGYLNYDNDLYKFSLYISELLLNTDTTSEGAPFPEDMKEWNAALSREAQPVLCRKLLERMTRMNQELAAINELGVDEKILTFSSAIRQLGYSLRALEAAPTKKYDFYSIYEPLDVLVSILEGKMKDAEDVGEYTLIYDFIHKISMTFHGTLRTDIQFFQIRDFNVTVHYAPAKLRAFYSLWTTQAAHFFEKTGGQTEGSHKFVLAPGMFGRTSVKELFPESEKSRSLMLITIPERSLYIPKWMAIVLTHEVSHFVGGHQRCRPERERYVFQIVARVLELEAKQFIGEELQDFCPCIWELLEHDENAISVHLNEYYELHRDRICKANKLDRGEQYHFRNTGKIFDLLFRDYMGYAGKKDILDFVGRLKEKYVAQLCGEIPFYLSQKITEVFERLDSDLSEFYNLFQRTYLQMAVDQLRVDMAEIYADVAAILTLQLFPEDYLLSFPRSDLYDGRQKNGGKDSGFVHPSSLRIYVVMCAVNGAAKNGLLDELFSEKWLQSWSVTNMVAALAGKLKKGTPERRILAELLAIQNSRDYMDDKNREYGAVYRVDTKSFENYTLNYYKDNIVLELLDQYLGTCISLYVKTLKNDEYAREQRQSLTDVYNGLAGKDAADNETELNAVVQTIESFLATYDDVIAGEKNNGSGREENVAVLSV